LVVEKGVEVEDHGEEETSNGGGYTLAIDMLVAVWI